MMTWYFEEIGEHTHVRVFFSGRDAGELCFRTDMFKYLTIKSVEIAFKQVTDIHGKRKPV